MNVSRHRPLACLAASLLSLLACTSEPPLTVPTPGDASADSTTMDIAATSADAPNATDAQTAEAAIPTDAPAERPSTCVDIDQDGYPATECGGMAPDCDDNNPQRNPGRAEVCDSMGVDEDCNDPFQGGLTA